MGGATSEQYIGFHRPMAAILNIQLTNQEAHPGESAGVGRVMAYDQNGFTFCNSNTNTYTSYFWFAIGNV